jgi:hypothetical protein
MNEGRSKRSQGRGKEVGSFLTSAFYFLTSDFLALFDLI